METRQQRILADLSAFWVHQAKGIATSAAYYAWRNELKFHMDRRNELLALPGTTPEDISRMDNYIRWARHELNKYDMDERADRKREQTKERVRRFRARKKGDK